MQAEPIRPEELSFEDGVFLVKLARRAVEAYLERGERIRPPPDTPPHLMRPGAAFVTIETYYGPRHRELRGCIGHVFPVKPLAEAVIEVALEAAFNDPRFPPLQASELPNVTFEVSVLGPMELLPSDPEGRLRSVVIGRHGLMARRGFFQGILLPQVPVEYLWDEETFLAETCVKAGLPPHCWLEPETEVYRYSARLWREVEPNGDVEERDLAKELEEELARLSG